MIDRDALNERCEALEAQWQANHLELTRLFDLNPPCFLIFHEAEIVALEAKQEAIMRELMSMDHDKVRGAKWKANKNELATLYSLSPDLRAEFGNRIDELEREQDRLEFELGKVDAPDGSRKWSGLP